MKRMSWFGVALLVAGLVAGALSVFVLFRASATKERLDDHLGQAAMSLREAEAVKESDSVRYEQLTQEAGRHTGFAEADQQEYSSQQQGGWYLAAGAAVGLAGGASSLLLGRSRTAVPQTGHR